MGGEICKRRTFVRPLEFASCHPSKSDQASAKQSNRAGFRDDLHRRTSHLKGGEQKGRVAELIDARGALARVATARMALDWRNSGSHNNPHTIICAGLSAPFSN